MLARGEFSFVGPPLRGVLFWIHPPPMKNPVSHPRCGRANFPQEVLARGAEESAHSHVGSSTTPRRAQEHESTFQPNRKFQVLFSSCVFQGGTMFESAGSIRRWSGGPKSPW